MTFDRGRERNFLDRDVVMDRDGAMQWLLELYRPEIAAVPGLTGGQPFVIFVTPARLVTAKAGGAPWVVIDKDAHLERAKQAWYHRPDPHGWSPDETRTEPVIAPRV